MAFALKSPTMGLSFLRPLALPRPSTINYYLGGVARASTATTTSSFPATTSSSSTNPPATATTQSTKPYRINLTPSQQYPVYTLKKRGGNMKLTRIRRLEGDLAVLRSELQEALGLEQKEVVINQLTRHIIVKGHRKPEIENFFKERSL